TFVPDAVGDLLYNGISQHAYKQNVAYAAQSDGSYRMGDSHTIRSGIYLQSDHSFSDTASQVLLTDAAGVPLGDVPESIIDNGSATEWIYSGYLQDEWRLV